MRLYVWEGVLTDYTDGIVIALAKDKRHAWKQLKEKSTCTYDSVKADGVEPRCISKPEIIVLYGGS